MLNPEAKNPQGARSSATAPDAEFTDPLFHRAAGAMQTSLQATKSNEGE
jgi:hypothetical protein